MTRKDLLIRLVVFSFWTLFFSYQGISQPLSDIRICIDAGHGGHGSDDRQIFLPNGIVYWESEGDLTTAFHLRDILEDLGANVKLTRTDNSDESDIPLSQRSAIANSFNADYFHSIHTNGGGGSYSLVLYKEENGSPAHPLAEEMAKLMGPDLVDLMKTNSYFIRGDQTFLGFNLGVLKFTNMPATLSESSFHDLPEEGLRLKNSEYLKNYAWALARSFLEYFEVGSFETGRVGGVITDMTSDEPVNAVTVNCEPGGINYLGDDYYNGFYGIGDLAPGDYELSISKEGYIDKSISISINAGSYLDLDLSFQYFNNGFPNLDFYISGLPAGAGEDLVFNAEKSTDDGEIIEYLWDFGDGSSQGSGIEVTHQFEEDGSYEVTLMASDDEGKQSTISKNIEIISRPPEAPKLLSITDDNSQNGVEIQWLKNEEGNIHQYKIYYSENKDFADNLILDSVSYSQNSLQMDSWGDSGKLYYFRMTAENTSGMESAYGDTYCWHKAPEDEDNQKILVVDGFNRRASYSGNNHSFAGTYSRALHALNIYHIACCSNSAIISGDIVLEDFDVVFCFLGDESTADETFSSIEQLKYIEFLEQGGKLFTSGSEIGWDLSEKGSEDDKNFYENYLKARYLADGALGYSPATAVSGSGFEGSSLHFGVVYPEDYPDEIGTIASSSLILRYTNSAGAGIKYRGTFGNGMEEGAVVNIAFPLESVALQSEIHSFIEKVMAFFNGEEDPEPEEESYYFDVYPTLFSDHIKVDFSLKQDSLYMIDLYGINGQLYYSDQIKLGPGKGIYQIPVQELPYGVYFLSIENEGEKRKIIELLKRN